MMVIKKYFISGVSIFVIFLFVFANILIVLAENTDKQPFTENNHITPTIWDSEINLNKPNKALVLSMNQKQWEALVAVCTVPAFISRSSSTPLMFSDSMGDITTVILHDKKAVTGWGSDAKSASGKLATEYWSKAELVFAVENYEQALWVVSAAAFISAPILVSPSPETLNSLSTESVIAVGNTNVEAENVLLLSTKEEVWTFQLELFESKGMVCNYVIITNPHDTDDSALENIKWRFQSPAAALLAAFRHGIVQTDDWSVDKEAFEAVESAKDPDESNYNKITPGITKLKKDSYDIERFLQDHGHPPEYLAAVGGPYAVPNYVYDIHVDYYFPTKNPQKTQYPSSLAAYATLSETIQTDQYAKEDLAAGRLAAGNIFDLTKQLMRSFFYREFLPGGDYYSQTPAGWEKKASFADGHRINQPEQDSLYWDRNKEYYPYEEVQPTFINAGVSTTYYLPKKITDPYDTNKCIGKIMEETTNYGYFHFMPHGGMTSLRIEVGIDNISGYQNDFLESSTIYNLNYKAPTFIYATCCKGAVWMLDSGYDPSDFIHSSFIHAGAVAYIATPEIQSACFWKEAPKSVAGSQSIEFWKNAFSGNTPIGKAFRDAKWTAHSTWDSKTPKPNSPLTHHVDCISYTLFGDPALEIYKPKKPFNEVKEMDVDIKITEAKSENDFTVDVSVKDLETGAALSNATVKIAFMGSEKTVTTTTFTAPREPGEYKITVSISVTGYSEVNTKTWVQVIKSTDNGESGGFIPGFETVAIISAFIIVIFSVGIGPWNKRIK